MYFGNILVLYVIVNHMVVQITAFIDGDYMNNQVNPEKKYNENIKIRPKVSDEYCKDKFSCNANHTCFCHKDTFCELLHDCCHGFKSDKHSEDFPDISKYSCKKIPAENNFGALVVSTCPKTWVNNESRSLCESTRKRLKISETYKTEDGAVFISIFCALCNGVLPAMYNIQSLKICANGLKIDGENQNENCTFLYDNAAKRESLRSCPLPYVFRNCPQGTPNDVSENCTNGEYGIVFDKLGKVYRNTYCGLCDNKTLQDLSCELDEVNVCDPYPFTGLNKSDGTGHFWRYRNILFFSLSFFFSGFFS